MITLSIPDQSPEFATTSSGHYYRVDFTTRTVTVHDHPDDVRDLAAQGYHVINDAPTPPAPTFAAPIAVALLEPGPLQEG